MQWISTRGSSPPISFVDALFAGTAPDGGLYMPERLDPLPEASFESLRGADIVTLGTVVGAHLLRDEITPSAMAALVRDALDFPVPLVQVSDRVWSLELFHGPTLAFKDVGARVQARLLHHFTDGTPLTILVATSGDTGSAVAQAFHRVPDAHVVVLYPKGKVSDVQEAQMASLGDNVTALAIEGTFDDCQRLVKQAFADDDLRRHVWLTPANSINLGRLLPQVFYYFLLAGGPPQGGPVSGPIVSVPSGNFGNLTAGLIAKRLGLGVCRFVAATNVNDAVPLYLHSGHYEPRPSIRTVANGELAFADEVAQGIITAMADEPQQQQPSNMNRLSEREKQIAYLVARGLKNRDIATQLAISENTVKRHLQSIFSKTGARDRLELAVLALSDITNAA